MKRLILTLISISITYLLAAQTSMITGRVLDAKTDEPLQFANVFINNTTIGAPTDLKGEFILRNVPIGEVDVVFSYVGYQSYRQHLILNDKQIPRIIIRLIPDEKELAGIEVQGTKDKGWERQLERFEDIFLGNTKSSVNCKITNSWVLDFSEDKATKTLMAKASQPLEIDNLALGYKVTFHLKDFKAGPQTYSILGYIQFKEMPTEDPRLALKWTQNRREVYAKSDRYMFKSILQGKAKDHGFVFYTDKPGYENVKVRSAVFYQELDKTIMKYNPDDFVTPGDREGEFKIKMKGRIEVHYLNEFLVKKTYKDVPYPVSWIEVKGGYVHINKYGVVLNSADVFVAGAMSSQRVADMLPLNYEEDKTIAIEPPKVLVNQLKFRRLQEKVFLHTDKPYYYGGEAIWFKGYMNYIVPEMRDSLSGILYVELINPQRKIIAERLLKIDSGFVHGDFFLSDTLSSGTYFLRAYTNWMRNYGASQIFTKPIPILAINQKVENDPMVQHISSPGLSVKVNKPSFKPREKIELEVGVVDEEGHPVAANLSVSVTDADQVALVNDPVSMLTSFPMPDKLEVNRLVELRYPVEYGVSFFGQFENDKEEFERATVTVVQGRFEDMVTTETDHDGRFWLNGFQFFDSAQLAFQAMNAKGKTFGHVTILPREKAPLDFPTTNYSLNIINVESPQRVISNFVIPKGARLLENVTIKGQKLEQVRKAIVYGKADYTVSGEVLNNSTVSTNILMGLQGRVPGLMITWGWDPDTHIQHYKIKIRGGSSTFGFGTSTEPLILVDGVPFTNQQGTGTTAGDLLATLTPYQVDRVEVITHANPLFGVRGTNGVIAVYTKSGDYRIKGPTTSLKGFDFVTLTGYYQPKFFNSPDYSDAKVAASQSADYRSTIFWSPEVVTNATTGQGLVSFYAADLETRYRVVVEGVTADGKPVLSECFLTVAR